MLQQHQRIANAVVIPGFDQALLQLKAFAIGNAAELEKVQDHFRGGREIVRS